MDPFSNKNNGGDGVGGGSIDDFSFDRVGSLNPDNDFLSSLGNMDMPNRSIEGEAGVGGHFDFNQDTANEKISVPSPSISQFSALNLQAAGPSTRSGGKDIEIDDDEDPFAALEAAIEEDKPKTEASPEWKRMLDAIKTEENEQQQPGASSMVPDNTNTPSTANAAVASDDMIDSSLQDDIDLDAPILLHPTQNDNNNTNDDPITAAAAASIDAQDSPSQVLAAGGYHQGSEATEMTSLESSGHGGAGGTTSSSGGDLAGTHTAMTPTLDRPSEKTEDDPAQEIEDIRRHSFAALQPICSTLLAHKNNPIELSNKLIELKQVLLNLQPAGVQSCVDYVIFPLQVALDGITATRGGGAGGDGKANINMEPSTSSSSTSPSTSSQTTAALPALKSDKTAEAALSALLVLLQRGTRCTHGDQLLSLLHRLCGILALPRESVSEEIRLGTLKIVTAAMGGVLYDTALQFAVREESSAPLIGHLGSVLVKAAGAEVDAGSSGSKIVRIEALKALKVMIQAVNCADALSFFLPGLVTGLARALLVAGGGSGGGGGGGHRSQGPAASGAAAVEALQGLTFLLQATLGNESVAEILNLSSEDNGDGNEVDVSIAAAGKGATARADTDTGAGQQGLSHQYSSWGNLSGDAALAELFKLSKKTTEPTLTEEEKFDHSNDSNNDALKKSATSPPPPQAPQPGETPKLRVDRTEEWVHGSATRIGEMLSTVLPPLATDSRADVREALVHACANLSSNCSLALSGVLSVFTDIILALAQDSWPAVAAAARSSLDTATAPTPPTGVAGGLAPSSPSSISSSLPILARAESSLKTWIYDLPAVLRRGDEAGKAHALKITTCLEACPPHVVASQLLSHSAEASRLVNVLAECFAVDGDSAGLLLVAAPEAAGTAFTTAGTRGGGSDADKEQEETNIKFPSASAVSSAPSSSVSVSLPRMPLGLQFISTQKTYECLANMVRTLAAVAAAADNSNISSATSGTALRSLIDGCLQHIQRLIDTSNASQEKDSARNRSGAGVKKSQKKDSSSSSPMEIASSTTDIIEQPILWTISAAQMVFVLTEIVFGASSAWQPKYSSLLSRASSSSKELEALIALVLPELVDTRIWNLSTSTGASSTFSSLSSVASDDNDNDSVNTIYSAPASVPSSSPGFTPKDRGSNASLQRAVLDCIGTSARALGPLFTSNGRLLRAILLPVIQKMGDPCPIVASSADTTIQAICTFCGYGAEKGGGGGGLRQLVADNADYIVDGLCRQLRQPEIFPMAPQLFAALLRQGGVAPGLVPLLAEPARQALLGISIVARRKRPDHVLSFVLCLREIAHGAGLVAQETCAELENFAAVVEERRELLLERIKERETKEKKEKEEANLFGKIGVVEEITDDPVTATTTTTSTENSNNSNNHNEKMEEINKYFEEYRARKQRKENTAFSDIQEENGDDENTDMENDDDDDDDDIKVPVLLDEWNQIQISRKKAASCATLAQSATDTAGPLILSSALPVAIQSIKTCSQALEALKYASRGVEICNNKIDPVVLPPGGVIGPTPDPSTAAFLPSVHLLWSPLMGALRDWRVAVVESVLSMLSHISQLAGSFLTRRFSEEAWPVMKRLLQEGPSQKLIIAPGQDDLSSPAVVQRAQKAVLACIRSIATGGEGTEAILSPITGAVLVAAADLMGERHPAVIREHATNAFVAVSSVDPDSAWGLLVAAIRSSHSAAATADKIILMAVAADENDCTFASSSYPSSVCPAGLPPMSEICPAPPSSTSADKYVPKGLKTCGEMKLLALLKQVNTLPVPWHSDVDKLLSFSTPQSQF